jgi:hypothetical protein
MTGQPTLETAAQDTNNFYRRTLHVLSDAAVPFLVGGSHAFLEYTGIVRNTKDFDLFLRRTDLDRALQALQDAGYRTERTFPHWLAKAWQADDFVDLVVNSGNGLCVVDDGWFEHAVETQVLGMPVKIVPCEELVWQKCFVTERERYDGALLYSYLILFTFVYPSEAELLPAAVLDDLGQRFVALRSTPVGERVCQGTLLSRAQYITDIGQYGYADARLAPRGAMSAEDAIYWTWAIGNIT